MLVIPSRAEIRMTPSTGPRVYLTPLEGVDARDFFAAVEGSRVALEEWLPWVPHVDGKDAAMRYTDASATEWDQGKACRFAIRDRHSRNFLGVVGLEMLQHAHLAADLGYWLRTDLTRQGVMTEASRVLLEWAFRTMGAHRIRVAASTQNHASLAVIRRLQFRFEGVAREAEYCKGRWLDHAVFGMLSREFSS